MINFLSTWIEQITITVLIVSIFELILPNGNIKKYIKVVLGIYIIFSIISPFVDSNALYNIENVKFDSFLDNIEKRTTPVSQQSMDSRLEELYKKELKEDIAKKIGEYGYEIYKADIDADFKNSSSEPGIHKINLILKKKGQIDTIEEVNIAISGRKENDDTEDFSENIENIKNNLATSYEIDPKLIRVKLK